MASVGGDVAGDDRNDSGVGALGSRTAATFQEMFLPATKSEKTLIMPTPFFSD
jgi:hypothetical protein